MRFLEGLFSRDFYSEDCDVNYPFNSPDDVEKGINMHEEFLDSDILDTCLYRQCKQEWKELKFNKGIVRAIARLIVKDFEDVKNLKGYAGYGFSKDGCFYADYYDGTAQDFNHDINSGITDFSSSRRQLFKIDTSGKVYACVLGEDGSRSKLVMNVKANSYNKTEKHSPSGLLFALTAYAITKYDEVKIKNGDAGYEVAKLLTMHYENLIRSLNDGSVEKIANNLRVLDNDIYELFRYENEVKEKYNTIPYMPSVDRAEYPLLTDTSFDMEVSYGNSEILAGGKHLASTGGYINEDDLPNTKTVKQILADAVLRAKYVLNPNRVLSEDEQKLVPHKDDMIPSREILSKLELIKESSSLPQAFRNVLWTGETGSGKSTAAAISAQLLNLPYCFLTINPDTILSDLYVNILPRTNQDSSKLEDLTKNLPSATEMTLDPAGSYRAITGSEKLDASEQDCAEAIGKRYYELFNSSSGFIQVESPLVQAFRYGWVCELQEVNVANKPGVLSGINAALDDLATIQLPDGEIIKRHPDCVIIMTANVDYEGTRKLNQAVKSRCPLKGRFNLPDEDALVKMIKLQSEFDDDEVIKKMIQVQKAIRKVLNETGSTDGSCGVREIIAWAKACKIWNNPYRSAMATIIPSSTDDEDVIPEVITALEN